MALSTFGLACEGVTDHHTIQNIILGCFGELEPDDIRAIQPSLDETSQKQCDFGGWEQLLKYLKSSYFRDSVLSIDHVVVQFDTDIIEHTNFGDSYRDKDGVEYPPEQLIKNTIDKLILHINLGQTDFYENYKEKIIFSICVHSLECWLLAYYRKTIPSKPKIAGCGSSLNHELNLKGFHGKKNPELYRDYSEVFWERKNIDKAAEIDPSFKIFIDSLLRITR